MAVNKVILQGKLGKDPEVRYTAGGTAYAKFSLAVTEKYKGKETVYWANIVAWGKTAEICGQYFSKGQEAVIEGKLTRNSWEKDGVKHQMDEIVISQIHFCGSKRSKGTAAPQEEPDIPF